MISDKIINQLQIGLPPLYNIQHIQRNPDGVEIITIIARKQHNKVKKNASSII